MTFIKHLLISINGFQILVRMISYSANVILECHYNLGFFLTV